MSVANEFYDNVEVDVYIDSELKGSAEIELGDLQTVGEWSISEGRHTIMIDRSGWSYDGFIWNHQAPDGFREVLFTDHFSLSSKHDILVSFGQGTTSIDW